jgi:hypothetical protein
MGLLAAWPLHAPGPIAPPPGERLADLSVLPTIAAARDAHAAAEAKRAKVEAWKQKALQPRKWDFLQSALANGAYLTRTKPKADAGAPGPADVLLAPAPADAGVPKLTTAGVHTNEFLAMPPKQEEVVDPLKKYLQQDEADLRASRLVRYSKYGAPEDPWRYAKLNLWAPAPEAEM